MSFTLRLGGGAGANAIAADAGGVGSGLRAALAAALALPASRLAVRGVATEYLFSVNGSLARVESVALNATAIVNTGAAANASATGSGDDDAGTSTLRRLEDVCTAARDDLTASGVVVNATQLEVLVEGGGEEPPTFADALAAAEALLGSPVAVSSALFEYASEVWAPCVAGNASIALTVAAVPASGAGLSMLTVLPPQTAGSLEEALARLPPVASPSPEPDAAAAARPPAGSGFTASRTAAVTLGVLVAAGVMVAAAWGMGRRSGGKHRAAPSGGGAGDEAVAAEPAAAPGA
jgi:hypothetical protein